MTWFRVWIEINLVFVSGGMQNLLVFGAGIEIDFSVGVEISFVFCGG